jgi:hypothetical protein
METLQILLALLFPPLHQWHSPVNVQAGALIRPFEALEPASTT